MGAWQAGMAGLLSLNSSGRGAASRCQRLALVAGHCALLTGRARGLRRTPWLGVSSDFATFRHCAWRRRPVSLSARACASASHHCGEPTPRLKSAMGTCPAATSRRCSGTRLYLTQALVETLPGQSALARLRVVLNSATTASTSMRFAASKRSKFLPAFFNEAISALAWPWVVMKYPMVCAWRVTATGVLDAINPEGKTPRSSFGKSG